MKKFCYIFFTSVIFSAQASAQHEELAFEHFTSADGLSAPVSHIVQDKLGYLWLGTTDGLNRFDGKNFVTYRNVLGDTNTIPNNIINALSVDDKGRIWAATNSGLCYFDHADGIFHTVVFPTREKLDRYRVHALTKGFNGNFWFATKKVLHVIRHDGRHEMFPLPGDEETMIKDLYADEKGNVWIGANKNRLSVFSDADKEFKIAEIRTGFTIERKLTATIHPIRKYKGDTLICGSWYAGLHKLYLSGDSIVSIEITDSIETDHRRHIVTSVARVMNSQLWCGTYGNGLAIIDDDHCRYIKYVHHDPSNAVSIGSEYINEVFCDASGIVWIGTVKGLDKYDPYTRQFHNIPLQLSEAHFAIYRTPSCIIADPQDPAGRKLYIAISGVGLLHYDRVTHRYIIYQADTGKCRLPDANIYTIHNDRKGRLWLGMRNGVCLFDPLKQEFSVPKLPGGTIPKGIGEICEDAAGRLWFASFSDGVYCYDEVKDALNHYRYNENGNGLPDDHVFCITGDENGMMWMGTQSGGLCRLDTKTGGFKYFRKENGNRYALPDNGVYDILVKNDAIWIATENGLAKMDPASGRMNIYTVSEGLCNNDVFSITEDRHGSLWFGTNNGLSCFNPKTGRFKNYSVSDGLPDNRIAGSVMCHSDGSLYFGTNSMISFFHPDRMKINRNIPPVVITSMKIFNRNTALKRNEKGYEPVYINYDENIVSFDFAALNFTNPEKHVYAYRLEGFDKDWIYCGNNRSAAYTNLDGGNYRFRVIAANNDGFWNRAGVSVPLTIYPPFWKTWWFITVMIIFLACILYSVYRMRIAQLMKVQQIRQRISRDLHDDVGSTLSSINMMSALAAATSVNEKKTELFNSIRAASQQASDLISDIVWSVNPENDRIDNLVIRLRQYAAETLEPVNISFTLNIDVNHDNNSLSLDKRKDFYLIYKEAINNCAKYSKATHVDISVGIANKCLVMRIEDNGCGFDSRYRKQGNGIANMNARARQINGDFRIVSNPGTGTAIHLSVPFAP